MLFTTILAATSILCGYVSVSEATVCSGHVFELTDVGRRSPSYSTKSSEPLVKDSTLKAGWYVAKDSVRFYALTNRTVPPLAGCGTLYPIYLKDEIPKVLDEGKEYSQVACLVGIYDNCDVRYNVKIRRCGREIQYFLIPTDGESAYCFEPTSVTATAPAPIYSIPGSLIVSVALMYIRETRTVEPEIEFKCNFQADNQYFYEVNWDINGRIELTFPPKKLQNIDDTNLNETTIRRLGFSLGFTVKCLVSVLSDPTGNKTSVQMSDVFYAGLKILNPRIVASSGSTQYIEIQPTIPLGCRIVDAFQGKSNTSCGVAVEMYDPNDDGFTCENPTVATIKSQTICGVMMTGWRRNSTHNCLGKHDVYHCSKSAIQRILGSQKIAITLTNGILQYPEDRTFTLQLKTGQHADHNIWNNSPLEEVKVIYSGGTSNTLWQSKYCEVKNDPNVYTFDRSSFYLHESGYYLVYNNSNQSSDVQVQIRPCDADNVNSPSCTCAVAVQAGGDVFLVDICSNIKRATFSHCRGNVLNVREINSYTYKIYLPHGTMIEVFIRTYRTSEFLNVVIHPSPADVGRADGLCGNLDGQSEVTSSHYIAKWRLTQSTLNPIRSSFQQTWEQTQEFCICPQVNNLSPVTLKYGEMDPRAFCFKEQYATCRRPLSLPGEQKSCAIRNKRSVTRHRRNIDRIFKLSESEDSTNKRKIKRSTRPTFTEAQAYDECLETFKSKTAYRLIDDLPAISLNDSLLACVNDVVRDGQHEYWKEENFNSWASLISAEISRNKTYSDQKGDIVSAFLNVTCPFQCNGNGDCVNGSCVCRADFVGDSCFVQKTAVIEMTDVEGGGICDLVDGDDCHECLQFHTKNLLKDFKCKIRIDEEDINGTVLQSDELDRTGEYENVYEGYCCPSLASQRKRRSANGAGFIFRYHIVISNDGVHYGNGRDVLVFDSTCQGYTVTTNGNMIFYLKDNTCFIDGQCYRNADFNSAVLGNICCPSVSKFHWTTTSDCQTTRSSDKITDNQSTVIAVCVSISGVLIVSCVVIFAIWTYKHKQRAIGSSTMDSCNVKYPENSNKRFTNNNIYSANSPPAYSN